MAAVSFAASVLRLPRTDLLMLATVIVAALFLILRRVTSAKEDQVHSLLSEVTDSAGAAMLAIGIDGRVIYLNPAGERLLGYHAEELKRDWGKLELLARGEGGRLVSEMQKLCGIEHPVEPTPTARTVAYLECVRTLPPSMVPSFEARLQRKDGITIPVTLHVSALRDSIGRFNGLVAVAMQQGAALENDTERLESMDRYQDLFENASEMIAALSTSGQFLYANPAWKHCFGLDHASLLALASFEHLFDGNNRTDAAAMFRRALDGETIESAPLRHHAADGRMIDLELSLSPRGEGRTPMSVRCMMRDVTQQKQREQRLALQIVVSQILRDDLAPEVAAMRVLEALCVAQDWELAFEWLVDTREHQLEFATAWGVPGERSEGLIQDSMGMKLSGGSELAVRAWKEERAVWVADLSFSPASSRVQAARRYGMVSGWAVPVRAANDVLAVLEFYSPHMLSENREALAAVETAAASLGQMIARTREKGRAEALGRQQKTLLDAVTDGICGVDRQRRVTFANPAAAQLLGMTATSITGKPLHELLHGNAPAERGCGDDCALKRATKDPKGADGEDIIFRADGRAVPIEYSLTPILDKGHYSGSVLSFRDISQRSALDRMKDEFISTVSHELRTPLTSIRGALGLLASGIMGELSEKGENLLRIALSNSERLVRLINDILDLEKIQSGREPLMFRAVQIGDIVRQAIDGMQPVADAGGVQLIHDAAQAEIYADPDRLLQVLTNLLSNAIKFSPPNSTVSIMQRQEKAGITLSVIDHGRGIPEDKLEVIFGRFQQVDASDSRQKGGSGLGLAICRTIMMQHSGKIWAERNPVRGSTFRLFLPFKQAPLGGERAEGGVTETQASAH
jgi:PAS domain S-box-containing protein